ncbi:MAG: hypothetical protein Rhims3KO_14670 [Hyphomicrobiales bacterium]
MTQFTDLGLAEPILHALTGEGYTTPTPIQAEVIPVMFSGRDILGIAQTGTGKTAAFVLPVLNALAEEKGDDHKKPIRRARKSCKVLMLVPTRELAQQIAVSIKTYGRNLRPNVAVVVGGASNNMQTKAMAQGVDILVATPGRLEDHMRSGTIKLNETRTVVLDEADQMLDMGFIPAMRRILGAVANEHQTVLLSATMPKPLAGLARDFLDSPEHISVAPQSTPINRIEQSVMHLSAGEKRERLLELLSPRDVERAIVFTRTKHGADKVAKFLKSYGLKNAVIHGNRSQAQREKALQAFKRGDVKALIATDVAARGIDIPDVSHVVNYELPNVPEAYVHRIGRTARAGKEGVAISFCDAAERKHLKMIERLIKMSVPVAHYEPSGVVMEKVDDTGARGAGNGRREQSRDQAEHPQRKERKARKEGKRGDDRRGADNRRSEGPRGPKVREEFGFDPLNPEAVAAEGKKPRRKDRTPEPRVLDAHIADAPMARPDNSNRKAGRKAFAKASFGDSSGGAARGDTARGDLKWFNNRKGYGFISQESGGPDVFVHISAIEKAGLGQINEGQKLQYDLAEEKRGKLTAVNLRAA